MTDINKLKEEELNELNKVSVEAEEVGLEELIILGEEKKIPIDITFPNSDGTTTKARALVKQLTLKEIDNLKINSRQLGTMNRAVLKTALFKTNGEKFTVDELNVLPIGVVTAIANQIMELSGVEINKDELINF